jgi:hypothetical protein
MVIWLGLQKAAVMRRRGRFKAMAASGLSGGLAAALILALPGAASAGGSSRSDGAFFVKRDATADAFFADRDACRLEAASLGNSPDAYSNPRYGALSAMGREIDSDALHGGDLRKRMLAAVFKDCMTRLGWAALDPAPDELKALKRASPKRPQALDAWLKAHEPPAPAQTTDANTPAP